jgi:hypothetical protein
MKRWICFIFEDYLTSPKMVFSQIVIKPQLKEKLRETLFND